MAKDSGMDRTEKPTPKKLSDARKKGQIAQSREIPSAMILITSLAVFYFGGSIMARQLADIMRTSFRELNGDWIQSAASVNRMTGWLFDQTLSILMPMMIALLITGIVANVAQFGFNFKEDLFVPNFKKMNPISGTKRLFSLKALVELVKSVFKIGFVGLIAYLMLQRELITIPSLIHMEVLDTAAYLAAVAFRITFFVCLGLIVLAAADFAYQRWQHQKELMMTKQEVKEERKQSDGDPQVKARIRSMQLEMAQRRMMEAIPTADVVITNPTHFAIAIRFDAEKMAAPEVVAKGADFVALRIREIAEENDVPLVENKPLARALFRSTEIGDAIPADLYRAVAEVLAYVYRLKGIRHPI
ncbi:MAG: flagellar biosynthesis protein FlhB [Desulfobacterales bacterium]|jgi:flagellar biosynthetic protein FlhB